MKEENKYVTILKVLLFVSLVSLLISAVVDLFAMTLRYSGGGVYIFDVQQREIIHMVIFIVFTLILSVHVITYGLHLFSDGKTRLPIMFTFVISAISTVSSLAFFVATILILLFGDLMGSSYYATFLAMYGTGFAISLLVTLLHIGDFITFLREIRTKSIADQ